MKEYEEECHSITFHPTGFHLVVAFTDKVRILNILEHDFVLLKEINIKNCKEVKFSRGGHLLALANISAI